MWLHGMLRHFAFVAYVTFAGSFLFPLGAHYLAGRVKDPRVFRRLGMVCPIVATVIGCLVAVLGH